jgi:hypothetical protein
MAYLNTNLPETQCSSVLTLEAFELFQHLNEYGEDTCVKKIVE